MKKLGFLMVILTGFLFISHPVSSQNKLDEGFIISVDDVKGIFVEKDDDVMMIETFYLENFPEETSSKPLHGKINQIDGVVKFGIASGSEKYNNQRRCYLSLRKSNYTKTFKKVLNAIPVTTIIENGENISIDECIEKINRKR
ncbi:MAG: hypothetical protein U9Q98_09355 [Bacteroidota bacterium]|nr:hypothetical protein [Bacteroidota bacterium]